MEVKRITYKKSLKAYCNLIKSLNADQFKLLKEYIKLNELWLKSLWGGT